MIVEFQAHNVMRDSTYVRQWKADMNKEQLLAMQSEIAKALFEIDVGDEDG